MTCRRTTVRIFRISEYIQESEEAFFTKREMGRCMALEVYQHAAGFEMNGIRKDGIPSAFV